jgi:hypothetical protein
MKIFFIASVLTAAFNAQAQAPKTPPVPLPTTPPVVQPKMTNKDAKKTCKEEGKTGADLIQCMKEKKEEK